MTKKDIEKYARGECSASEKEAVRQFLIENPDLILQVIAIRRQMSMEKLHINGELEQMQPILDNLKLANAANPTILLRLLDEIFDKEFSQKSVKNSSAFVTESTSSSIKDVNQLKNQKLKNMETINISQKVLEGLYLNAQGMIQNADKSRSTQYNMMVALLARHPELSPDQAQKVCVDIINGVTNFNETFKQLQAEATGENITEVLYTKITESIKDKPLDEQANCMLNFMAVIRTIDAKCMAEALGKDEADVMAEFNRFMEENHIAEGVEATPEMLEEIRAQLRDTLECNSFNMVNIEGLQAMAQAVSAGEMSAAEEYIRKEASDLDRKAYVSLSAYMAALEGNLPGVSTEPDAQLIAINVSAGMERGEVIDKASRGLISWQGAAQVLILIAGAALLMLFGWIAIHISLWITGFAIGFIGSLISFAWPIVLFSALIGLFFSYKIFKWVFDKMLNPVLTWMGVWEANDKINELPFFKKLEDSRQRFFTWCKKMWHKITGLGTMPTIMPTQNLSQA